MSSCFFTPTNEIQEYAKETAVTAATSYRRGNFPALIYRLPGPTK